MARADYTLKNLKIPVLSGLLVAHALAIMAVFYTSKTAIWLFVGLSLLTAWVGVGVCYHRLLTHDSFETPRWFRYVLTTIGTLSGQAGPLFWVGWHKLHHSESDKPGDPHSPNDGGWWAHFLWLLFKKEGGHDPLEYSRRLAREWRGMLFLERYAWLPQVVAAMLLLGLGYWRGGWHDAIAWVAWGVGLRMVYVFHLTWFINSGGHMWGYRNFETHDHSRNIWFKNPLLWTFGPILWVLTGGEAFHNNHHGESRSASHGMKWWEIDINYRIIQMLSWVHLAYNIHRPKMWGKAEVSIG
jgi:stearoyl-CoA desaturase (delta-9 desaturase)